MIWVLYLHLSPARSCFQVIGFILHISLINTFIFLLVLLRAGDVPIINVLDRKWNNDDIAATLDLKTKQEVSLEYLCNQLNCLC